MFIEFFPLTSEILVPLISPRSGGTARFRRSLGLGLCGLLISVLNFPASSLVCEVSKHKLTGKVEFECQ